MSYNYIYFIGNNDKAVLKLGCDLFKPIITVTNSSKKRNLCLASICSRNTTRIYLFHQCKKCKYLFNICIKFVHLFFRTLHVCMK